MTSKFHVVRGGRGTVGDGGPEGPDMEERVGKLEEAMHSIDGKLSRLPLIEGQIAEIKVQLTHTAKATDVAEIKGRLTEMPRSNDWAALRAEVAAVKEKLNGVPNSWQMMLGFIGIILAILWKTK